MQMSTMDTMYMMNVTSTASVGLMDCATSMELINSSKMDHRTEVASTDDKFVLVKTKNEQCGESVHPFKNDVAMRRSSNKQKNAEGFVLFPKVTKFGTYLVSRYGKRIEAELEEMFIGGEADYICEEIGLNMSTVDRITCSTTPRMTHWRINRYEFIADVEVSIRADTWSGDDIECNVNTFYASLNCCLDEEFSYFIDRLSVYKPDRARIRLDEYLIPIMTYEEIDQAAEGMWEQYLPEVFQDKGWLNPYRLAERMGLKVVFHQLHRRKKNRGLLFWKDGTVKIVPQSGGSGVPEEITIEAGTIVVNNDCEEMSRSQMAVFHECFHDEYHWLFFRLQDKHNDDLKTIRRVKKPRNQGKAPKNPLKMLEWEAREGARMLMLPTSVIQPMIDSCKQKLKWKKHAGELYQSIGISIADELNVAKYQVRQRLLQLGYWQARGSLNYMPGPNGTGRYLRPFMFTRESCPSSAYTFVITPQESFRLYEKNEEYRERINSGRYVYVEGHVCVNDPEYVQQGKQGPYMTKWANEHIDECCLRFLNVFESDEDYEFNLNYVCSDEEYNQHYIDFVARGKKMTESEANERASKIVMEMPQKPGEALQYLMKKASKPGKKDINVDDMSERCGVSRRTVYYWCKEEYQFSPETFIRIVVGLHLPPFISMRFMNVCGVTLQFHGIHMMYWKIVNCYFMDTIYEVNRQIEAAGFPAMKETV